MCYAILCCPVTPSLDCQPRHNDMLYHPFIMSGAHESTWCWHQSSWYFASVTFLMNLANLANGIVLYLRLPIISQNCTYWTKSIYFKALLNSQFPDAAMVCIN